MAERDKMRKEAEDLEKELREIENLNLDNFDFDSMPLTERLRLLREIKRICLDYGLYTKNWDPAAAQEKVNELIPQTEEDSKNDIDKILTLVYISIKILDFVFFWVPIIGGIIGVLSSLATIFVESIGAFGWNLISAGIAITALIAEIIVTIVTAAASAAVTTIGKLIEKGLTIIEINKEFLNFCMRFYELADNISAIIEIYSLGALVIDLLKVCIGGLEQIWS